MINKNICLYLLAAAVSAVPAASALAQAFPNKPMRLILPYPPGGGSDTIARPFARKMAENNGRQPRRGRRQYRHGNCGAFGA